MTHREVLTYSDTCLDCMKVMSPGTHVVGYESDCGDAYVGPFCPDCAARGSVSPSDIRDIEDDDYYFDQI